MDTPTVPEAQMDTQTFPEAQVDTPTFPGAQMDTPTPPGIIFGADIPRKYTAGQKRPWASKWQKTFKSNIPWYIP